MICAYTAERIEGLGEALASVRRQSRSALETVLVIDHAPELQDQASRLWADIRVVPNAETQGLSGARNSGVAVCGGDIVAFLDDDAVAAPDWLQRLAALYADPAVLGAGGSVRPRWLEGEPPWFPPEFDWVVGCTHSGMPTERARVRNLVGANMSFRREVLVEAGGFRRELGRVGTLPVGCEETDLCIRIGERWPEGRIVYEPAAGVEHVVPGARGRFDYFRRRCVAEGSSKAVLAGMVGEGAALASERSYVRRTLPLGFARNLRRAASGEAAGLSRAAMLVFGLGATTFGYARAKASARGSVTDGPRPAEHAGDRPLRVLMVTPRSPLLQGGVERHVMEVSRRLAAGGVEIEVLCGDTEAEEPVSETRDGVPIRSVPAHPKGRDYYFAPALWREMGRRRWDLVHVQSYHTLVAPLAMLRALSLRVPYVVTFHGGGHSSDLRNRARGAQMRLLWPLLARAARLVAVARFEIERYGAALGLGSERFVLIPNGTDLAFSAAANGNGRSGPTVLATIGRLERYKGHQRVLAALPHVLARDPEAQLLIVGTGPYEQELRRQATALGVEDRVTFTSVPAGDPAAMAELLGGVSLVVLLSEFETHPLVALEAAAAGRRLLVADAGGLAEIAADGHARAIALDEAPAGVAAAIAEELARSDLPPPPRLTSWDECAEALLELYRSVA